MANELRHSDVGTALSKSEWEAVGGHIFNSQAAGDIMYASTTSQLTRLGIGTANQVLATNSGATAPEWVTSVASATLASTITVVDSTDTSSYIAMFDSATGSLAAKTDAGLTYNAGTGMLTATGLTGPLTGVASTATALATGRTIGGVSFDGTANIAVTLAATATALASARTINGVSFDGTGNITVTAAGSTLSDTVTVAKGGTGATSLADKAVLISQDTGTDTVGAVVLTTSGQLIIGGSSGPAAATLTAGSNITISNGDGSISIAAAGAGTPSTITVADTTDTSAYVALFDSATGDLGPKTDAGITYNAGTGMLTATGFTGPLTGNASGTAATVTGAAQSAITSLGTLTTLTVDSIIINGTNIGHTSDTDAIAISSGGVVTMNQIPVFSAGINVSGGSIAGTIATASQTNITAVGTIATGVWQGTAVAQAYIADNSISLAKMAGGTDGNIISYDASGDPVAIATGDDGQVLTSAGAGQPPAFEDAGGGGTIDLTNQGAIPAGAPVAISSTGKAVVISGLGNDLFNLGLSHDLTAGTTDNPSGRANAGTAYSSYATQLVDAGATGLIRVFGDGGYNRIRVVVGTYSQTAGTTAGTREIQWGVEATIAVTNSNKVAACWNTADSLLCLLYKDTGDGSRPKMVQYPIANKTLGTASSIIELEDVVGNDGSWGLEWDENDDRYIAMYSINDSTPALKCGVYRNDGGNPAQVIAPAVVTGDAATNFAQLKWANGASGKDDCGIIMYEDAGDSSYIKCVGVTHNNSDTITFTGTPLEPFGANKAYDLDSIPRGPGLISFDTTAPPAAGGFATSDDVFVLATVGTDADGDHIPYIVPVAVDSSDCSLVAGTVETPYTEFPDHWMTTRSGATTFADVNDLTPISVKSGSLLTICYDPDRDVHVIAFRISHYYGNPDVDGGEHQGGSWMVTQTLTLNASDNSTIDNTYNTEYHPVTGNRQNHAIQAAVYTTSMSWFKPFYYGIGLHYHTTYDTMFVTGETTIAYDMDSEYEYIRMLVMAFNGQTTAQGGSAALTYAPSNVDRIIGFNTTAISDTGTGATATISLPGSENTNQTGLTTGKKYFIADSGTLTGYRSLISRNFLIGGIATSASTKIMPKLNTSGIQI